MRTIPALLLVSLSVGCAQTRTYQISLANQTHEPITFGLVKQGEPFEQQWASPEDAAIYGDKPEVRARLSTVLEHALDRGHLRNLLDERALVRDVMDVSRVHRIREDMERAEARRLQPHYIESFFLEAFRHLGGSAKQREPRR